MEPISRKCMELFVPGRLCILGEHTDWIGGHREANSALPKGYTLVCATNEGLHARVGALPQQCCLRFCSSRTNAHHSSNDLSSSKDIVSALEEVKGEERKRNVDLSLRRSDLMRCARDGGFFSYVAGTALAILESTLFREKYPDYDLDGTDGGGASIPGLLIDNYLTTLPMQKGLSSSAAVCVLTARAFISYYELCDDMSMQELMELAFVGEMYTPSRCGRMDQCVAMGQHAVGIMKFDGKRPAELRLLKPLTALYFVVVDLKAYKDTVCILQQLNDCFPFPTNHTQELMHEYAAAMVTIAEEAVVAIEEGNTLKLGSIMQKAQAEFDRCAIANCPTQLEAPILHSLINSTVLMGDNEKNEGLAYAVKGVGSQGDGSAQILCRGPIQQEAVLRYVRDELHMDSFMLTIPAAGTIEECH